MTDAPLESGSPDADEFTVVDVDAADTHALRRFVLRRGTPTDNVNFATDAQPGTRHLAIRDDTGAVIATSTWFESEAPTAPGVRAVQLRAMAVHDDYQGRGLGAILIEAGTAHAVSLDAALAWANARDSALGFYTRQGFDVVGDGFLTSDTRIPHHVVVRVLDQGSPSP
jgi:GNAT superfamily N-acetyltransferase